VVQARAPQRAGGGVRARQGLRRARTLPVVRGPRLPEGKALGGFPG
jgi:hypothetical protein